MANETLLTIIGNLTDDPELRFTQSGKAVANFTVASTPRKYNSRTSEWEDGDTLFLRCSIWDTPGENTAESLYRGARVIVQGRLVQRSFDTKEGEKRTVIELQVDEVGPSLRYATAKVTKTPKGNGGGHRDDDRQQQGGQQRRQQQEPARDDPDPWASAPRTSAGGGRGGSTDDPPF